GRFRSITKLNDLFLSSKKFCVKTKILTRAFTDSILLYDHLVNKHNKVLQRKRNIFHFRMFSLMAEKISKTDFEINK
uniref:Uncharacterized protein n=1 Tax=Glossina morsitans morsitans TaxID=37546 RepID=A0A1B0FNM9_GLOMM